jgi:diguanylate cyclase (GGDEF)-like protein
MKELTPKGDRRRILLIDDELMQFTLVRMMVTEFHAEQFEVDWAPTYAEGMGSLMSGRFCACFLDYRIGDANGLELLKEAKARGCTTPIIMLTGSAVEDIDMKALEYGAMDYMSKTDLSPRLLERALRYAIKLSDSMRTLESLATHDDLTGLLNRREMERVLGEELSRAERFRRPLAFILIDLDHFKQVNDSRGHLAGDHALRHVSAVLASQLRNADSLARFGGEEFGIVAIEADPVGADALAERCRAELEAKTCRLPDGSLLEITLSAGVACFPQDGRDVATLVHAADQALYSAKARGRNRCVSFAELA